MRQENIIITRHPACITLGKNSSHNEIISKTDLPIFQSDRGGGATYHDLGQLGLYPFINLKQRDINITQYIQLLQNWVKNALNQCNIQIKTGTTPGLWMLHNNELQKIAFVGLNVKNGFVGHGISINLSKCKIENFNNIIPCNSFENIGKCNVEFEILAKSLIKENIFSNINILIL